jgi:hypothetical protein
MFFQFFDHFISQLPLYPGAIDFNLRVVWARGIPIMVVRTVSDNFVLIFIYNYTHWFLSSAWLKLNPWKYFWGTRRWDLFNVFNFNQVPIKFRWNQSWSVDFASSVCWSIKSTRIYLCVTYREIWITIRKWDRSSMLQNQILNFPASRKLYNFCIISLTSPGLACPWFFLSNQQKVDRNYYLYLLTINFVVFTWYFY